MKQTVHFHTFQQAFEAIRPDNFSYEGLTILFEYIEEYEESCGEETELDVIALCCEYSEDCADDIIGNYCLEDDVKGMDDDEKRDFVRDYLNNNTMLCGETAAGDFVYLQF